MDRRTLLRGMAGAAAGPLLIPASALRTMAQGRLTKLVLLVGTAPPDPACHYFFYAAENGFYAQHGIEVEIKPIAAETTALRGVLAGEGDIGWVGAISTLQAIAAGSKLRVMSCYTPRLDYLVVCTKDIANLKGFDDRSFSVSQVGAVSQMVPQLMIEQAGGDSSKVKWVSVGGSSARLQALIAKRVDAAALNSSFTDRALQHDNLHVVGDAIKDLPNFIYGWEIVEASTVQKKKEALQAFTDGTMQGVRWAIDNPDKAAAISQKLLPDVPPAELVAAADGFAKKGYYNPSGKLPKQAWDFTIAALLKLGNIKQRITYEDIVLSEFVDAAPAQLGKKI